MNFNLIDKNFPESLKKNKIFVCFRFENVLDDKGVFKKRRKVPYNPETNTLAKMNDSTTWSYYEIAKESAIKNNYDGIGIVLGNGLMGIDMDNVLINDSKNMELVEQIINTVDSYTEISPSGKGIHIIFASKNSNVYSTRTNINGNSFEFYRENQYFTITGNVYNSKNKVSIPNDLSLEKVFNRYMGFKEKKEIETKRTSKTKRTIINLSDEEIINYLKKSKIAAKFNALYEGNIQLFFSLKDKHNVGQSYSEAEYSFCLMLSYYTNSIEQIDKIYRASKLYRKKWETPIKCRGSTYGLETIKNAIANQTKHFKERKKVISYKNRNIIIPNENIIAERDKEYIVSFNDNSKFKNLCLIINKKDCRALLNNDLEIFNFSEKYTLFHKNKISKEDFKEEFKF